MFLGIACMIKIENIGNKFELKVATVSYSPPQNRKEINLMGHRMPPLHPSPPQRYIAHGMSEVLQAVKNSENGRKEAFLPQQLASLIIIRKRNDITAHSRI